MVLVIPVSKADIKLARLLADRIVTLGGVADETVYVAATENDLHLAIEIAETLGPVFNQAIVAPLQNVREDAGWPVVCNDMFLASCRYLATCGEKSAFYFMEADNLPLKEGWFKTLEDEYYSFVARKVPFYGATVPTRMLQSDGSFYFEGTHLIGSAIYPPGFPDKHTVLGNFMRNTSDPWDVYMRHAINKLGVADTGLIQNNWRTGNYRYNSKGQIEGDGLDPASNPRPVSDRAVVLHGCKDDSLWKCLRGCMIPAYTAEPEQPKVPVKKRSIKAKRRKKAAKKTA